MLIHQVPRKPWGSGKTSAPIVYFDISQCQKKFQNHQKSTVFLTQQTGLLLASYQNVWYTTIYISLDYIMDLSAAQHKKLEVVSYLENV